MTSSTAGRRLEAGGPAEDPRSVTGSRRKEKPPGPAAPALYGGAAEPPSYLEDIRRSERTMILVRGAAAVFALVQVLAYRTEPYPPGVKETGLALAGMLAAIDVGIWLASRRTDTVRAAQMLSVAALSVDVAMASAFVWLYAFDPITALWAILYILPLEGAIRFGLSGSLAAWFATTVLYAGREIWGSGRYGYPLEWESISFRMGIAFLIALVAGLMARSLTRQRAGLSRALSDLSRIDTLRARLVATLAHDIRNPLTTIRGTLKTLARHSDRLDATTREELARTADRQAERLERLAGDLLDLARLERGRLDLTLEDVSLRRAVVRALSFADEEDRYESRIDEHVAVRADPARLEQIVVNLVTNGLQYGAPPYVVEAATERDGWVHISFRDHGRGVSPEQVPHLFEPFRADIDSDSGSVGLGLAIVRALVEAMGGRASYEPNRPRGSCFRVVLRPAATTGSP